MTSTRSALDADWLAVCRRAVEGLTQVFRDATTVEERAAETGTRGEGGDRTLVIDRGAESVVLGELDRLRDNVNCIHAVYGDSVFRFDAKNPLHAARK